MGNCLCTRYTTSVDNIDDRPLKLASIYDDTTAKLRCKLCHCDVSFTELWNHFLEDQLHEKHQRETEVMMRQVKSITDCLKGARCYESRIATLPCRQWQDRVRSLLVRLVARLDSSWTRLGTVLDHYGNLGASLLVLDLAVWKAMCRIQTPFGGFKETLDALEWWSVGWKQLKSSMCHCSAIDIVRKQVMPFLSIADSMVSLTGANKDVYSYDDDDDYDSDEDNSEY